MDGFNTGLTNPVGAARGMLSGSGARPVRQESTADRIKRREAAGLRNHREGGGNQNRSGVTPIDGSFRKAVEAGPDGKVTPGTIPPSVNTVWKVPDSTINNGRDNSRVVPGSGGGIVQTGTDMSRSFNDLLAAQKTTQYNKFSSNQLPTTPANPFEVTAPKTQSFIAAAPGVTENSIANFGGDKSAAFAQSRETTANDTFNPDAARIEGGSSRKPGGSLSDALADTAGINSYMSKFSSGDQARLANRAFLDVEDSMDALRAKEAVNGVVFAQNQHYISGKSGDDKAIAIDRGKARDISSGKAKAQDFLQKKVTETTAAAMQEPTILENAASSQAFQQDKPMSATMPGNFVGSVDFISNNDNIVKPFGGPKGYSAGFKRINTSMPNPFGG